MRSMVSYTVLTMYLFVQINYVDDCIHIWVSQPIKKFYFLLQSSLFNEEIFRRKMNKQLFICTDDPS